MSGCFGTRWLVPRKKRFPSGAWPGRRRGSRSGSPTSVCCSVEYYCESQTPTILRQCLNCNTKRSQQTLFLKSFGKRVILVTIVENRDLRENFLFGYLTSLEKRPNEIINGRHECRRVERDPATRWMQGTIRLPSPRRHRYPRGFHHQKGEIIQLQSIPLV